MGFKLVCAALFAFLAFGCTYHYSLSVITGTEPPRAQERVTHREEVQPRVTEESPSITSKPQSIQPGDFKVSQSNGGTMVNINLYVNQLRPLTVSTNAEADVQGLPLH